MDTGDDIAWLSAGELLGAYRDRRLSPVEVLASLRSRCERLNPLLNAFYEFDWDGAGRSARESEHRWRRGSPTGLLDGVPVSVKDHLPVRGFTTPRGLFFSDRSPAAMDAAAVAHLRNAGAVLFGKTVMPEFSVMSVTDSVAFGPSRNPWDLARSSGGSSGGASAAVAAGLGPLALASDGGGSIRHPCGFTGLVGVKPTHGRVPYFPGPTDRTVAGPMARTVGDAARMLAVLARPDGRDWTELPRDDTDYVAALDEPLRPLRIAYSPTFGYLVPDAEIRAAVERGIADLRDLGHEIEDVETVCEDVGQAHLLQAAPRYARWAETLPKDVLAQFPPASLRLLEHFAGLRMADYDVMLQTRDRVASQLLSVFASFDALVSPVSPSIAPRVGEFYPDGDLVDRRLRQIGGFTRPFNLVHMPAVAVPVGYSSNGMPIGIQLAAPKFSEALLLRLARQVEACFLQHFGVRRPTFAQHATTAD